MRKRTLTVYANPYAHIDANGRLAGATPIAEAVRPTSAPPARQFVGATRVLVEYDKAGRGIGSAQQPRAEYLWQFTGEGLEVPATGQLGAYYQQRIASGELFPAGKDGSIPLAALAKARSAALEQFRAEQGEDAETTEWGDQFPLDLQAEAAADIVAEQDAAAATKAKADAERTATAARTAADRAAADSVTDREKARADAKADARRALGVTTSAAPTAGTDGQGGPGLPAAVVKASKKENDR